MLQLMIANSPKLIPTTGRPALTVAPDLRRIHELTEENRQEALAFLAVPPVHTIVMMSFIHDNGFDHALNRGEFYGYRGIDGKLEGIALIGHSTLFEARTDEAIRAFAFTARTSKTPIHLIMSAGEAADDFWRAYRYDMAAPRLRSEELLFEASFPFAVQSCNWNIENANESQLVQIAEAQAEVAFAECGVDPMARDRERFLKRVLRRIQKGRVFSVFENDTLVFKADIIAETSDVIYLEGVYVAPEYRGKGVGPACLSALTVKLLSRASHICLLSNIEFGHAHRSFQKAGYKASDKCVTLFV